MDANLFRYRIVDLTSRYENVYFDYPTPSVFMPIEIAKKLNNKPGKPLIYTGDGSFCWRIMRLSKFVYHPTPPTVPHAYMLFVPVINSVLSSVTRVFDSLTGKANNSNLNHRNAKTSSFSFTGSSTFTSSPGSDAMNAPKGLSPLIQEQRVIKSEAEIKLMRQAGEISGKAFIEVSAARMRFFKQMLISVDGFLPLFNSSDCFTDNEVH